jgi:DNA-binding transcriptional ArsR family regulator
VILLKSSREYDAGVLKALSNSMRREIIRHVATKGSASYTQIMQVLGLDPSLESGTFNYHLKELAEVGLIESVNGEYRITPLGNKALILLDQVREEPQVDRYGVLSAAISMTPREELYLFKIQMGSSFGFALTLLSFIGMIVTLGTNQLGFVVVFTSFVLSLLLTASSISKLIHLTRKYNLGLSVLLFITDNWFLLRSPNRGNFMAFGGFAAISIFFMAFYLLLVAVGSIPWISGIGVAMIMISIFTAPFALILADTAIKKVEELESMDGE